ncbi:MAG: hypothetical protein CM1200mP13_01260 [Candidatus Pelagibacterales bacterium]|nr:MAG: hypothetical protein CM1200mP13_01260 [Pelagibacterales bacterium]
MEFNIALSVFIISSLIALILIQLQKKTNLPGDALLGLLAHSSLAVGLVVIGFLTFIRFDIMGLLFGDILAVTADDLLIIWIGGPLILLILKLIWKPLFASTVNYELAEAEGLNPDRAKAIFTILMAGIIAISIKMVGLLLIKRNVNYTSCNGTKYFFKPSEYGNLFSAWRFVVCNFGFVYFLTV